MKSSFFKKFVPYACTIIFFIVIAYAYTPEVLSGKKVNQSDISSWQGMANEIVAHNQAHPDDRTLWTNSMFSGMPATSISVIYEGDYTQPIYNWLFIGERPASYLIISLIGGFLLFLAFGVDIYLAALGAIAITFCSYNMQIIQVGHNSKMVAIAFMPWVLASVVYSYRKKLLLGAILFSFALSFQIKANHPQITYYLAMIIAGFAIWQLCAAIKEGSTGRFFKTSLALLIAGLIGIATNTNHLWPTYEYAEHTMRGGSELTEQQDENQLQEEQQGNRKSRTGLDIEYATAWSYGVGESLNMLIPNLNGGSSSGELGTNSESYKALQRNGYAAGQIIKNMPLYWGPQPFTAGPMYMGAITIFLCILGFCLVRGGMRWWVMGVGIIALMLSWGYHFMPMSKLFFNYAPLYNKFRTVSMILVILQILIPVMAVAGANNILHNPQLDKKRFKKAMIISLSVTCGFSLLLLLIPSLAGSFQSASDAQLPEQLIPALVADRISLLRGDAFRSMAYILAAALLLYLGYSKKIKANYTVIILSLLVLTDLWSIDKRYLNSSHFVTEKEFNNAFAKRPVDDIILSDKSLDYRVLDLSVNTFNDAYTSYYHKTIGGYSPAKLQRYQDLIEHHITGEINHIVNSLNNVSTIEEANEALEYEPVLSMLNNKYIIINPQTAPIVNRYALGNAWFVENVCKAANADEENEWLSRIDPATDAVIANEFITEKHLGVFYHPIAHTRSFRCHIGENDSLKSTIELTSYAPNRLVYRYNAATDKIVLFSEVFYAPGWKAEIKCKSGEIIHPEIFRANYILRALAVPAGEGEITFTFAPESFRKGEIYSRISSILLILALIAFMGAAMAKNIKNIDNGKQNL